MNPFDLLKNVNMDELKKKGEETMAKLKEIQVTGESGGGFVKVTINGEFQILSIDYEDSEFIKDDLDTFRDLIIAAYNQAAVQVREQIQQNLSANIIPGMFNG
ncbi:MAG: YbaB/EbfC family nucleoid-associated protein [Spirochaetes bacterium]|nr:YbaB/EbfC family nucleoid-associated protein [Spirochaetota bacterium]